MISTRKRPIMLGAMLVPGVLATHSVASVAGQATPSASPSPPTQPSSGPGGADYAYDEVVASAWYGQEPYARAYRTGYWLFEPAAPRAGAPLVDAQLPLVLFLVGGMEGIHPENDRGWIDHIVRRGAVVVCPAGWLDHYPGAEGQVSEALIQLERGNHVPVDLTRLAVVGQGVGGAVAAHMAAAPPEGMSTPNALMVVTPEPPMDILAEDLATLPAETRVVLVGAESASSEDNATLDGAWAALAQASQVSANQRAYVVLRGDTHGSPSLEASQHVAHTVGPDQPDALDWYGTWKYLDALMGCAFTGEWCAYAFGDTPEVRSMGTWSDGVPVTEALVVPDPAAMEATPAG